jgi:hypothetical protein
MNTLSTKTLQEVIKQARRETKNKGCRKLCHSLLTRNSAITMVQLINEMCIPNRAEYFLEENNRPSGVESVLTLTKFAEMLKAKAEMEELYKSFSFYPILYCLQDDNKYQFFGTEWKVCQGEYHDHTLNVWEILQCYYSSMLLYNAELNVLIGMPISPETIVKHVSDAMYGEYTAIRLEYI